MYDYSNGINTPSAAARRQWDKQPQAARIAVLALMCLCLAPTAEGRQRERALSEIDAEYLSTEVPVKSQKRHKCSGMGQLEPLKGEWVSS